MGNMEQVRPGSQQFHSSSEHCDNGVDDIKKNPKHYIIWSTNMNTHIHPEYIVSLKSLLDCVGSKGNCFAHSILGTVNHAMLDGPWQQGCPNEMVRHQQSYPILVKKRFRACKSTSKDANYYVDAFSYVVFCHSKSLV